MYLHRLANIPAYSVSHHPDCALALVLPKKFQNTESAAVDTMSSDVYDT